MADVCDMVGKVDVGDMVELVDVAGVVIWVDVVDGVDLRVGWCKSMWSM